MNYRGWVTVISLVLLLALAIFSFLSIFDNSNYSINNYQVLNWEHVEEDGIQESEIVETAGKSGVNLGVKKDTTFIYVEIGEVENLRDRFFLEVENPTFRVVQPYFLGDDGVVVPGAIRGISSGYENNLMQPNPNFEFPDSIGNIIGVIFKIYGKEPLKFRARLNEKSDFRKSLGNKLLFASVYAGIMLALFLYNMILFFMIRDRVYFYYCFYILFICLAQLSLSGHSFYFFLDKNVKLYELSIVGFTAMSSIFVVPFIQLFLKTKAYLPRVNRFFPLIIGSYLLALVLRLLGMVEVSYQITDLNGLIVVIAFVSVGVYVAKTGYRPAVYFLIAWGGFLFGLMIYIFQNLGVVNLGSYGNIPMLVGTAIEAVLLSLALADRINILKREKEEEQHAKLEVLKENERLVREQNVMLEEKVKLRTEELEQTLLNLQNTQTQLVNQEKMASLGQLTAGIAHEINNPINFVSSNISPLKRDMKDMLEILDMYRKKGEDEFTENTKKELNELEEDLEFDYLVEEIGLLLKGMEDGAKRTVEIVKGLRLFSRVDEQDVKKVDIHDGINSTLVLLNNSMGGNIEIKKEYGHLPMVECLAGKINQVFMNIISNAVQALQEKTDNNSKPTIIIRTTSNEDEVQIEIEDNGPGMPIHVRERIFEPFFTTKAVGKGTGLGLSIVYKIIENHHGQLNVVSEENKGTTFIIKLPIYQNVNSNEQ
ncbi:7TM diverse intracellular signaling domain-containing protein [Echinicola jeungdonensis]|uniref:histidine kinase n=2 Tax=Echinicola jeungdonensis TaxID=709343 RepID=A0ABV5JAQ8_9BACT|nr:7TM diverse intracellular signaling domain-containing protein [Echinicola jeungdonensis]MDN3669926.1 7TM diverse intracellular signaling domain-containing protein [Echinicola jeungdonensis]